MILRWICNFTQNLKKCNFLWAIRWRRRYFFVCQIFPAFWQNMNFSRIKRAIMGLYFLFFYRGKYYFTSMPFENIMVLRWISNFRQNWKKRNFLWAIRWRRRSFSWAAHNGFYHALIPLYCSQALLMWSDKGIKKPSICFTAHFELIPSVWLELGGATCA